MDTMKAVICTRYGAPEVLQIQDIKKPEPSANEVLIRIFATTVTVADCRVRAFDVPLSFRIPARFALGFSKPKKPVLGSELSGIIVKAGKDVTTFKTGDEVFAFTSHELGAYAAFITLGVQNCIAIKPKNMTFEQSAALSFGGISALYFIRKAAIQKNESILIYGASGSVGTYAIQLAKNFGAVVTAVCSTGNMEMVKKLGADYVVDYTQTNVADINEKFDIVFDAVGKCATSSVLKIIKPDGRYIHLVATPFTEISIKMRLLNTKIKFIGGSYTANMEQINAIKKLAEENIIKPIIDKRYCFEEIVEAHRYADTGHKKGNVVITITDK